MSKKIWLFAMILLLALLSACGNGEENTTDDELGELDVLEVEFNVPETAEPGETVELQAAVTYGDEAVEDADEVLFEIWEYENEDDSIEIEGSHQSDGIYTAETTFEEDGIYEMYAHTTARDQHTMPLVSIVVGDVSDEEIEAYENDDDEASGEHEEEHNHNDE